MYRLLANGSVLRLADRAIIPADAGNGDYQAYQRWVAAGGQAELQRAVTLTPSKNPFTADGADQCVVSIAVAGAGPPASIAMNVGGTVETVPLVAGAGALPPIVASSPVRLLVRPDSQELFDAPFLTVIAE